LGFFKNVRVSQEKPTRVILYLNNVFYPVNSPKDKVAMFAHNFKFCNAFSCQKLHSNDLWKCVL